MKTLESERLILRKWNKTDIKDFHEYGKSSIVGPLAGWKPHANIEESKEILESFIKSKEVYALYLKSENKIIGSIGIHKKNYTMEVRELGFVLNPKYWGRGFMPEAVKRVLHYCFTELQITTVKCSHFDFNDNAKRVLEKCGFDFVKTENFYSEFLDKEFLSLVYEQNYEK